MGSTFVDVVGLSWCKLPPFQSQVCILPRPMSINLVSITQFDCHPE
jgi:hypothetical protein